MLGARPMAYVVRLGGDERVVVERGDRNLAADEGLDVRQRDRVSLAAEADRVTRGARPGRTADAVDVVFGVLDRKSTRLNSSH